MLNLAFFLTQIAPLENIRDTPNMPNTTFCYDNRWVIHFWYADERGVLRDASIEGDYVSGPVMAEIGACTDYRRGGGYSTLNNTQNDGFTLAMPD